MFCQSETQIAINQCAVLNQSKSLSKVSTRSKTQAVLNEAHTLLASTLGFPVGRRNERELLVLFCWVIQTHFSKVLFSGLYPSKSQVIFLFFIKKITCFPQSLKLFKTAKVDPPSFLNFAKNFQFLAIFLLTFYSHNRNVYIYLRSHHFSYLGNPFCSCIHHLSSCILFLLGEKFKTCYWEKSSVNFISFSLKTTS